MKIFMKGKRECIFSLQENYFMAQENVNFMRICGMDFYMRCSILIYVGKTYS